MPRSASPSRTSTQLASPLTIPTTTAQVDLDVAAEAGLPRAGLTTLIAGGILVLYGVVAVGEGLLDVVADGLLSATPAAETKTRPPQERLAALCEELQYVLESPHPDPATVGRLVVRARQLRHRLDGAERLTRGSPCEAPR